jgi:hypothetical protein
MSIRVGDDLISGGCGIATTEELGVVQPDGTTISITEQGIISANVPDIDCYTKQESYNKTQIDNIINNKQDKGDYALNTAIPTKVSQLTNDAGYLTQHQDISGKANKATTLSGYGITNAYTKTEIDTKLGNIESLLDNILGA